MLVARVRAVYAYKVAEPDELTFEAGDIIELTEEPEHDEDAEWFMGRRGSKVGTFPAAYVEPLSEQDEHMQHSNDQQKLPNGWFTAVDPSTGEVYYYNSEGKSTWDHPTSAEQPRTPKSKEREYTPVNVGLTDSTHLHDRAPALQEAAFSADWDERTGKRQGGRGKDGMHQKRRGPPQEDFEAVDNTLLRSTEVPTKHEARPGNGSSKQKPPTRTSQVTATATCGRRKDLKNYGDRDETGPSDDHSTSRGQEETAAHPGAEEDLEGLGKGVAAERIQRKFRSWKETQNTSGRQKGVGGGYREHTNRVDRQTDDVAGAAAQELTAEAAHDAPAELHAIVKHADATLTHQPIRLDGDLIKLIERIVKDRVRKEFERRGWQPRTQGAVLIGDGDTCLPQHQHHHHSPGHLSVRSPHGPSNYRKRAHPGLLSPPAQSPKPSEPAAVSIPSASPAIEDRMRDAKARVAAARQAAAQQAERAREAQEAKQGFTYKECRSTVYPPSGADVDEISREAPSTGLRLEHIYGYNGGLGRFGGERYGQNVLWLLKGDLVYPASSAVVIFDCSSNEQRFFLGHDDEVVSIARHPAFDICASGQIGRPARVCVFDAAASRPQQLSCFTAGPLSRAILCLDFSPDSDLLLVVWEEEGSQAVSIWDWRKATMMVNSATRQPRFHCMCFNPLSYVPLDAARHEGGVMYTLVSGGSRQIKFWTLTMEREGAGVGGTRSLDGRAILRPVKGERGWVYKLEGHNGSTRKDVEQPDVLCVCFVREGGRDASQGGRVYTLAGTDKGAIHVWTQLEAGEPSDAVKGVAADIRAEHPWLPRGRLVSIVLNAHQGAVMCLCYCPEQHCVASAGKDGLVTFWTPRKSRSEPRSPLQVVRSVQLLGTVPGVGLPRSIAWNPEQGIWAVGSTGCSICMLNPQSTTDEPVQRNTDLHSDDGMSVSPIVRGHTSTVRSIAVHPSLPVFATISTDKTLRVWDAVERRLAYVNRLWDKGTTVAFHTKGAMIAVGTEEGEVVMLDCDQDRVAEARVDEWRVMGRRAMPVGAQQAADTHRRKSTLVPLGECPLQTARSHGGERYKKGEVMVIRFSPDGKVLAVAMRDRLVHFLAVELHFRRVGTCRGHSAPVVRMDFSADSTILQTNDGAREILYWDVATGKQVRSPSIIRDVPFATWTALYGFPVQGIWDAESVAALDLQNRGGANVHRDVKGKKEEKRSTPSLPVVCRSHNEQTIVLGQNKRVRLLRYPALKGAASRVHSAHTSNVTGVAFLVGDETVLSAGGTDMCVFQWSHHEVTSDESR